MKKGLPVKNDASLCFYWSGRQDLNLRPPDPQSGALPGCATPRNLYAGVRQIDGNSTVCGDSTSSFIYTGSDKEANTLILLSPH